ncbi:MAG: addiction module protein [Bacteroidia bacterium]
MIQIDEILKLSIEEKKELIEKLWESIPEESYDVPLWQVEEGKRRLKEIEDGKSTFTGWDDFRKELVQHHLKINESKP